MYKSIPGTNPIITVGDYTVAESREITTNLNISAVINLHGEDIKTQIETHDFMLPSQELLDSEKQKIMTKLNAIADNIHNLRNAGKNVLVVCEDGKNKCMLAVGYYLIMKCGAKYIDVIYQLETLYFDQKQHADETFDRDLIVANSNPKNTPREFTNAEFTALEESRNARREIRCLTMQSFARLLRLAGGARK